MQLTVTQKKGIKRLVLTVIIFTLCLWAVWAVGYSLLSEYLAQGELDGFAERAEEYLSANAEFTQACGRLLSLTRESEIIKSEGEANEYYMDLICHCEGGDYPVRYFERWDAVRGWYSYYLPAPGANS